LKEYKDSVKKLKDKAKVLWTEDERKDVVNKSKTLMGADLGHNCEQACLDTYFSDGLGAGLDPNKIVLQDVVHVNDVMSIMGGKCSVVFRGLLEGETVAVHVYVFGKCRHCPCLAMEFIKDGKLTRIPYVFPRKEAIGCFNSNHRAVAVKRFAWNKKARVLWIAEEWCDGIEEHGLSFSMNSNRIYTELYTAIIPELSGTDPDTPPDLDTLVATAEPVKRQREDEAGGPPPLTFLSLKFSKPYICHGTLCFRQHLLSRVVPIHACFDPVPVISELKEVWGSMLFITLSSFMEHVVSKYPDAFKNPDASKSLELFFKDAVSGRMTMSSDVFVKSVQYFGFWWKDLTPFERVWPFFERKPSSDEMKSYFEKQSTNDVGSTPKRHCFFRAGESLEYCLTARFNPTVNLYGRNVNKVSVLFDLRTKSFCIVGSDIFGKDPVDCLEKMNKNAKDGRELKLVRPSEDDSYINK